jgi:transposase
VALGFTHAVRKGTGRPGYTPADLLKLYIYGYLHKLRSSRTLEQETQRNVELMWLLCKLRPDCKTLADVRTDHAHALKQVCRELTLLCKQLDLFGRELIVIDGSKFKAVNSQDRHVTAHQLKRLLKQINDRSEDISRNGINKMPSSHRLPPPQGMRCENKSPRYRPASNNMKISRSTLKRLAPHRFPEPLLRVIR